MPRNRGNRKRRGTTNLCLEFALHGQCGRGDECTFGHGDDDDIAWEDYDRLLQNLGKVSYNTLAQAVANVIQAQMSTFDDDDDDDDDEDDEECDWDAEMETLKAEHDLALQLERQKRDADVARLNAQLQTSSVTYQQAFRTHQQATKVHQQTLDQVRAAHASEVLQLNERIRLLAAAAGRVVDPVPSPSAAASFGVEGASATTPLTSPEVAALVVGVSLAVTQVATCCGANSGRSASQFVLNPCLAALLNGTKAAVPVSWLRFRPSLLAMGTATASDFVIGFHGSPTPEAIMCQGWDANKRQRQQHGPGEYFDTDMHHSLASYAVGTGGVVVALILRSEAALIPEQPTWLLVNNPTGVPCASTATYCFPLGYVMVPWAVQPQVCTNCTVAFASLPGVAALTKVEYHDRTWLAADPSFARNVLAHVAVGGAVPSTTFTVHTVGKSQFHYTVRLHRQPDGRTYAGSQTNTSTGTVRLLRVV